MAKQFSKVEEEPEVTAPAQKTPQELHIEELKKKWDVVKVDKATGNIYCTGKIFQV